MVDETTVLPALALELTKRQRLPLCLDSNNIDALTAGLWASPGTPLVNSISGEPGRMSWWWMRSWTPAGLWPISWNCLAGEIPPASRFAPCWTSRFAAKRT